MTIDLSSHLSGEFGQRLRHVATTVSTNSDALAWAAEGVAEGAVVVADHQTGGRGRWGRGWTSAPGGSLLFSIVLRPPPQAFEHLGLLSVLGGVATAEAVARLASLDTRVKWPNDVVIDDRKLAGVLAEARSQGGKIAAAVLGVGLNLSLPELEPDVAARATSLTEHGVAVDEVRPELLGAILGRIEEWYGTVMGDGGAALVRRAEELSSIAGREVTLGFSDGDTLAGRAIGLSPGGGLVIETPGGVRVVDVAEVLRVRAR